MKLSKSTRPAVWFAPKALGNRALPPEQQLRVQIEPLSVHELNKLRAPVIRRMTERDVSPEEMGPELRDAVITARVQGVQGLEDDEGPVTTAVRLVAAVNASNDAEAGEILDEIYNAVMKASVLREGAVGN